MHGVELLIPKLVLVALVLAMLPASVMLEGRRRRTAVAVVALFLVAALAADISLVGSSGRFWADSIVADGSTIFAAVVIVVRVVVLVVRRVDGGAHENGAGGFLLLLLLSALGAS